MKRKISSLQFIFIFLVALMATDFARAQLAPPSFVYQGQITKAGGIPLEANPVVFNVRIYSPINDCLLYEEQHSINMLASEGAFSLSVGAGIRSGTDYEDTSSIVDIFRNGVSFTGITNCASGTSYNALTGHTRKVRVSYNDGSGLVTLAQDFHLPTVPYAWYANSLQGLNASNFVQVNAGQNITQSNLENLLGGTNYNTLYNLASGTPTSPLSMNNQQIKNLADPTLAQDAATKNYSDTRIGGSLLNLSGVGAGLGNGRVLAWNATLNQWEAITSSAITDATKLPLAGGTMGGNINMGGNQILNTGHVTMQNLSTITLGKFSAAQETTLVATLGVGNKGATWYNSTTDKIMYWDGDSAEAVGAGVGTGDIEAVATATGSGLSGGVTSGTANLALVTDSTTVEINGSNQLQVKDSGVNSAKLATDAVSTVKIADGAVTNSKITSVSVDKITSAALQYFSYMPAGSECLSNEVLKWDATNDRWLCGTDAGGVTAHNGLTGLGADDHTQYVLLAGRTGGQSVRGGIAASENLILDSTSHGTKGFVILQPTAGNVGIGTTNPQSRLDVSGTIRAQEICDETGSNCKDISGGWGAGGDIDGINTNAGSALSGGTLSGTATLSVVNDGTTIETNGSNQLQVKDSGVSLNKLAADSVNSSKIVDGSLVNADINAAAAIAWSKIDKTGSAAGDIGAASITRSINTNAGSGLTGGGDLSADRNIAINTDNTTLEIATNTLRIKDGGVTNAKINSLSISKVTSAAAEYFSYMPAGTECTNGYTLVWDSTSDRWLCGALPTFVALLRDSDNDTKIQVEESANENKIRFDTAGSERMIIDEVGNVGIGTNNPSVVVNGANNRFAVVNSGGGVDLSFSGNGYARQFFMDTSGGVDQKLYEILNFGGAFQISRLNDNNSVRTTRLYIDTAGNVGIGTNNPLGKLDVAGTIRAQEICDEAGSNCKDISGGWGAGGDIDGIVTNTGSALIGGTLSGTATLSVVTDGSTLETNGSNQLQLKNLGVTTAKLAVDAVTTGKIADGTITNADIDSAAAIAWSKIDKTGATAADVGAAPTTRNINTNAGSGLTGGGNLSADRSLAINTDNTTLEISTNTLRVKDGGITNAKINSVSVAKVSSAAAEYFSYMPAGTECTNGFTLVWDAVTDRWVCGAPSGGAGDGYSLDAADGSPTDRVYVDNAGNVAVGGTGTGDQVFAVSGGMYVDFLSQNTGSVDKAIRFGGNGSGQAIGSKSDAGGNQYGLDFYTGYTNRMAITSTGNVGIGTTNPQNKLTIVGSEKQIDIIDSESAFGRWSLGTFSSVDNTSFVIADDTLSPRVTIEQGGNVGIGTTAPGSKLEVTHSWSAGNSFGVRVNDGFIGAVANNDSAGYYMQAKILKSRGTASAPTAVAVSDVLGAFSFSGYESSTYKLSAAIASTVEAGTASVGNIPGNLVFQTTNSSGVLNNNMFLNGDGNLGIGTATPSEKLQVAGIIHSTTGGIKFPDGSIQTTSATAGTNNTLIANVPDVIGCSNSAGGTWYLINGGQNNGNSNEAIFYPSWSGSAPSYYLYVNLMTLQISTVNGWSPANCTVGTTMSALYSAGRAFNFVKGPAAQFLQSGANAYYNAGFVGIGTNAPAALLTVAANSGTTTPAVTWKDTSAGADVKHFRIYTSGGQTNFDVPNDAYSATARHLMSINHTTGNVGIGTTNAGAPLDVVGGIRASSSTSSSYITSTTSLNGGLAQVSLNNSSAGGVNWSLNSGNSTTGTLGGSFGIAEGASYRMVIAQGGNVGIGIATPAQKLHLNDTGANAVFEFFSNSSTGSTSSDGSYLGVNSSGDMYVWNQENLPVLFGTNNGERMRIAASGTVGIGTTNPSTAALNGLHVNNTSGAGVKVSRSTNNFVEMQAWTDGRNYVVYDGGDLRFVDNGGVTSVTLQDTSGNVGIGTTSPGAKLDVSGTSTGNIRVSGTNSNNYAGVEYFEGASRRWSTYLAEATDEFYMLDADHTNGVYLQQNNSSWLAYSDVRLKENIQNYSVLDKIDHFRAVSYDWKSNKVSDVGVIAQEIVSSFPEVVDVGDEDLRKNVKVGDKGVWGVKYDKLSALAMQGVKELYERLKQISSDLTNLKALFIAEKSEKDLKIKNLENENAQLKAYLCEKDPSAPFCKSASRRPASH